MAANGEIFYSLAEAKVLIEAWRRHYNTIRPHSSLGYRPPAPEAVPSPVPPSGFAPPTASTGDGGDNALTIKLDHSMGADHDLAIDSKLRGCDIVKMKIGDIVASGAIRNRATVIQQKTGRPVQFEQMTEARATLLKWLTRRGGTIDDFIFPSRVNYMGHLSTRQYARLVDEWVGAVGLNVSEYGTHSMRRTKASLIYKATGNLRAVQILLGHTNIENTVRYLGVDIDDAITLAERTEI